MDTVSNLYNGVADTARMAGGMSLMGGRMFRRYYKSATQSLCLICNNLQPHGHEGTLDNYLPSIHRRKLATIDNGKAKLTLADISTKDILQCREKDEKTGLVKRECRYCRLLCEIFDAFFIDEYMNWVTETKSGMPISVGLMIQEGSPLLINCWGFTYVSNTWNPRVDLEMYVDTATETAHDTAGMPCMGPTGTRSLTVGSQKCRRFILESVRQCRDEHDLCVAQAAGFVPSRLLYIGTSNEDLKIFESSTETQQLRWVALSHCWGGIQPFRLLQSNLSVLKTHVNISDLPATFLNAISITRELGLRHIWIDSLCIIQDSKPDWETEAATMGKVYGSAFLVLCAASSKDPETPFIASRESSWLPKIFPFPSPNGTTTPMTVRQRSLIAAPLEQGPFEPPFTSAWALQRRAGPLYERGWCFQETFLALRTIHFSPGGLVFECKTHRRCEDQLPPYPSTVPNTLGEVNETESWHMIVRAYTQRQLTFPKDKLTAIGGAASNMPQAQTKTSKYLAGLWHETLLQDLMWQVMPGNHHLAPAYPGNEPIAPSWSWASVNRAVLWNPLNSFQPLAEVISASTTLAGANPYGQVTGGSIRLRGRVRECVITTSTRENEHWVHYIENNGREGKKVHFRPDGLIMAETGVVSKRVLVRRAREGEYSAGIEGATASFLCVAKTPWMNYNYVGLVLCQSPTVEDCVVRVGSVTNVPSSWYKSGVETTVTII